MAVTVSPVPLGNVTQALNTINANFQALSAAFNQYLAQTNPIANPTAQGLVIPGQVTSYNGIPALGTPVVRATAHQSHLKTGPGVLFSYAVGPAPADFLVNAWMYLRGTKFGFVVQVQYYPDINDVETNPYFMYLYFQVQSNPIVYQIADAGDGGAGIGTYGGVPMHLRCKANTSIVLSIPPVQTFTTVDYDISAVLTQLV